MADQVGPVATLLDALARRDLTTLSWAMAADVVLSVPSLGVRCTSAMESAAAMGALLEGFPDFTYTVRSRYTAPGQVTDEVLLQGTQAGELFGRPPSGRSGSVQARVLITHDDFVVRTITLWVDQGAIAALVAEGSELSGTATPVMAALRATIPQTQGRVFVGQSKMWSGPPEQDPLGSIIAPTSLDALFGPPAEVAPAMAGPLSPANGTATRARPASAPAQNRKGKGGASRGRTPPRGTSAGRGAKKKAPIPRHIRRGLGFIAGVLMLAAAVAIISWVGISAWRKSTSNASEAQAAEARAAAQAASARPTATQTRTPTATATTPRPTPSTTDLANQVTSPGQLKDIVLLDDIALYGDSAFTTNSSVPRPELRAALIQECTAIRTQGWSGEVRIDAWADSRGAVAHNQALSIARAKAIAQTLTSCMGSLVSARTVVLTPVGRGVNTDPSLTVDQQRSCTVRFSPPGVITTPGAGVGTPTGNRTASST